MHPDIARLNPAQISYAPGYGDAGGQGAVVPLESTREDDVAELREAIRSRNGARMEAMIQFLEPQVDGSAGPVNPRLAELYLKAMVEQGKLYGVYQPVSPKPVEEAPETAAARLREVAEKQLRALQERTSSA